MVRINLLLVLVFLWDFVDSKWDAKFHQPYFLKLLAADVDIICLNYVVMCQKRKL